MTNKEVYIEDFAFDIIKFFLQSSNERSLLRTIENNYKEFSILPMRIPVSIRNVDGKLFFRISLNKRKVVNIQRELGDIIFVVKYKYRKRTKYGFAFVQVKNAKIDISSVRGEKIFSTKNVKGMNKGQLFLYSGLLEKLANKKVLFNINDGYFRYYVYWISIKNGLDESIVVVPARHLLASMHIPCHLISYGIPCVPCNYFYHWHGPCWLKFCLLSCPRNYICDDILKKFLNINAFLCKTCISWIYSFNGWLKSALDVNQILFPNNPPQEIILANSYFAHTHLINWLVGAMVTHKYFISKTKLDSSIRYKRRKYKLGELLLHMLVKAYNSKKMSTGYKNSKILIDPDGENVIEVRDLHEDDLSDEEFSIETDDNSSTLLVFVGFEPEDFERWEILE